MSDNENADEIEEKPFFVEIAKQGRAGCKKCKQKCPSGEARIAKLVYNPFGGEEGKGKMKQWYHIPCLFEIFLTQRPATKRIDDVEDIEGFETLDDNNREVLLKHIEDSEKKLKKKWGDKLPKKEIKLPNKEVKIHKNERTASTSKASLTSKDFLFRQFRRIVAEVTNESSYLEKTAIIKTMLTKGADGTSFKGDILQWCRLLLPGVIKRIYNLQSKQLVKLFSKMFDTDQDEMLEHLEQGDIGETIQNFFEKSNTIVPNKKSLLTIQEVDDFLEELSKLTKEDEQMNHFKKIIKKCTGNDLKIIIRLIKHDLRMNAGAKHILEGVHEDAYEAFQSSRDLSSVLSRVLGESTVTSGSSKSVKATINVMTPVLPMLAEACKSVEQAMKKCPNGMYSEIKYDGERVQLHKHGNDFKYYSRSLKPVMPHKVNHFKDYIPLAFPHAKDLILDAEILMIDTVDGKPLPFGSLGVHKKAEFKNANVCLFVFDCIYFNGEILTQKTMRERRKTLLHNMTEIKNHVMFSEVEEIHKPDDLTRMITKVLKLGLEGLVLKDLGGIYEPGKRHWLKVKKDYLCDGAMADSADLIVLGAWFGTGRKGGMMSIFLMGCYDAFTKKFLTVTKVHTGHDDKTLQQLQSELQMTKISSDFTKIPGWLKCTRTMVPDFVANDPKKQPVWEITGAEFTQHDVHTADGISIRFPRVTRIRSDKTWEEATSLQELKILFKNSKENIDFELLTKNQKPDETKTTSDEFPTDKSVKDIKIKTEKNSDKDVLINESIKVEKKIKEEIKDTYEKELDVFEQTTTSFNNPKGKKSPIKRNIDDPVDNARFKKIKIKSEKDLFPTIFTDTKIVLMDTSEEYDDVIRHFIAVGGDVLKNEEKEKATHVIHSESQVSDIPKDLPLNARHVVFEWVKDSIANARIQDTRPYAVVWVPS